MTRCTKFYDLNYITGTILMSRHLAFDPTKTITYNRVPVKVTPIAPDNINARLLHTGLGIFFDDNVVVKYNGTPLSLGVDYVITGYSKHLKHTLGLDGFGIIALLSQVAFAELEIEAHHLGGGYTMYNPENIPQLAQIIGSGVSQILWDDVVVSPMTDTRTLDGLYPPETKSPMHSIITLLGVEAEKARSYGVPKDKTAIRTITRNLSINKLGKIPGGLNTGEFEVVDSINSIKQRLDEVQTITTYIDTILVDSDLRNRTFATKSGWVVGVDNVVVQGYFPNGVRSVLANSGDTITYIPEGDYLLHEVQSTDYKLVKESWFNNTLPSTVKDLLDNPLGNLLDNHLNLVPWYVPFGGYISTVRGNTIVARDVVNSSLFIISEAGVSVTYWDGVKWNIATLGTGTVVWWDSPSDITRIFTELKLGKEPLHVGGVNTLDRINELLDNVDTTGLTVGSVLETFRSVPLHFAIPLGSVPVSRTVYSKLFSIIGETYGEGDGSTTFGIPPLTYGSYRGAISMSNISGTLAAANTRLIKHPTETSVVFSVPMGIDGTLVEVDTLTGATITRALDDGITGACSDGGLIYIVSSTTDNLVSYNPTNGQVVDVIVGMDSTVTEIFKLGTGDYLLVGDTLKRYSNAVVEEIGLAPNVGGIGGVIGLANNDHFLMAIDGSLFKISRVSGVSELVAEVTGDKLWIDSHVSGDMFSIYEALSGNVSTFKLDLSGNVNISGTIPRDLMGWTTSSTTNLEFISTDHLGVVHIEKEPAIPRYVVARAEEQ